ncbi:MULTISPECIES: ureidoglycolate lyase [Microvirgula]|nr:MULTISPECIES: ureidoglycolate lyase [Microvirgula]RAS15011.1 ureidoglycolate lyase [Microvirgula sp. AG722]
MNTPLRNLLTVCVLSTGLASLAWADGQPVLTKPIPKTPMACGVYGLTVEPAARVPLKVEPLTKAAFAPYGDVIEPASASKTYPINNGETMRYHDMAAIQANGSNARPIVSIFESKPVRGSINVHLLERHPYGSQAFVPLDGQTFLVVVAAPGDKLDPSTIKAFITDGKQGVNYHAGVWHHPVLTLGKTTNYLIVDRSGDEPNCQEIGMPKTYMLGRY